MHRTLPIKGRWSAVCVVMPTSVPFLATTDGEQDWDLTPKWPLQATHNVTNPRDEQWEVLEKVGWGWHIIISYTLTQHA